MVIGFHKDETLAWNANDYLKITVCSDATTAFTRPQMRTGNNSYYASCATPPGENAGDPSEQVFVAADYNFTFVVLPIFKIEPNIYPTLPHIVPA